MKRFYKYVLWSLFINGGSLLNQYGDRFGVQVSDGEMEQGHIVAGGDVGVSTLNMGGQEVIWESYRI